MKKILVFCVASLITTVICQAAVNTRFNLVQEQQEAPVPEGSACACAKVNVSEPVNDTQITDNSENKSDVKSQEKSENKDVKQTIHEQFAKDMAVLENANTDQLSDSEKEIVEKAKNKQKEMTQYELIWGKAIYDVFLGKNNTVIKKMIVVPQNKTDSGQFYYYHPEKKFLEYNDVWDEFRPTFEAFHEIVQKLAR